MSKRNRSALRTVGFLILAVFAAQAIVWAGEWLWGYKEEYNHQRVHDSQVDSDDLRAQQEMADWAFAMVALSGAGFVLSSVGIILIWGTFKATQRGNKINRQIGEAQTRAYVSIDAAMVSIKPQGLFSQHALTLTLSINNSGNSPALKLCWIAQVALVAGEIARPLQGENPERFIAEFDDTFGVDIPGQNKPAPFVDTVPWINFSPDDLIALRDGKLGVVIDIHMAFRDVFGRLITKVHHFSADLPANKKGEAELVPLGLGGGTAEVQKFVNRRIRARQDREILATLLRRAGEELAPRLAAAKDEDEKGN